MQPPTLFDQQLPARDTDPDTSHAAAALGRLRRGSARHALAVAYARHPEGLTDEEAAMIAGLDVRTGPWKRCSELRAAGIVTDSGERALTAAGTEAMVCVMDPGLAPGFASENPW